MGCRGKVRDFAASSSGIEVRRLLRDRTAGTIPPANPAAPGFWAGDAFDSNGSCHSTRLIPLPKRSSSECRDRGVLVTEAELRWDRNPGHRAEPTEPNHEFRR